MKNLYFTIGLLFISYFGNAQIITIPDVNFKSLLLNYSPVIDTNNDGEIQISEALLVTELNLGMGIQNISGLEYFTNLTDLELISSSISNFSLAPFPNLESIELGGGYAYTGFVNFSICPNLNRIHLFDTLITGVDLTGLSNLTELRLENNDIETIDLTGLTNLSILNLSKNRLSNLNLNGLVNLTSIDCSSNKLTTLDLSNFPDLLSVDCSDNIQQISGGSIGISNILFTGSNSITTLICSFNTLTDLNISNLINLTHLNCSSNQISDLQVSNFTNLETLICSGNSIANLDVENLVNLTILDFLGNTISSINVLPSINLTYLDCSYNAFSNIDVSSLSHLTTFRCNSNPLLNTLNLSNLSNLELLDCSGNNMSSLDTSNLQNLKQLTCQNNQITSLDLSNNVNLEYIYVSANLLTSLDLSQLTIVNAPIPEYILNVRNNPNLTYLNLKNGIPFMGSYMNTANCPNLSFICVDEESYAAVYDALTMSNATTPGSTTVVENVQINAYCSFVPGGTNNSIIGEFTMDINNNGCDATDYHPQNIKVKIEDETNLGSTFTNANGNFFFYNQTGDFTITPQFENPYFTLSPASATLNFPNLDGSSQTQNFCITPNGIHNDVDVTILPITPARPGFDATYQLVYKNKGNQMLSGTVTFNFDDATLDFISATTALDAQATNTLSWNYTNLLPFESRTIDFVLNVNGPMETPPVNIDDNLNSGVSITSNPTDENQEDNIFSLNQTVIGSFDPNDKTCLEGDTIPPTKVGDYLHYLIRFQNSGTAPAENVVIKDIIDTSKFDLVSLQLTATSHPQVTRITGNKVEFVFENIQLPAEQDDEPGSHGYVAFKIRTKNNLVLGNTVSNTANIYFDYNFPIVTNTATTTIAVLSANEFENTSVAITPNPVKNDLNISANDIISSIQIYDVQGRLIATQVNNSTSTTLDMSQQNVGVYFVKVITENGVKVEKIIKN